MRDPARFITIRLRRGRGRPESDSTSEGYSCDPSFRVKPTSEISLLLHYACVLDFDVSRPATLESNNKSPVVRVLSVNHEPTFCAIVPILAVVRRQDARKQTIFAVIDPNGELCARIPSQMRFDAKPLTTAILIKGKNNV